ncbi:hypothetical protein Csa_005848 [Cucumis sativus]|uniref:Lipid transfer protein family protein n=1 Tax=Cucumis sativus TaxID=3659 RepID=A0A0A0KZL4_CUCSA|nr:hypothetical protein Csa_005848 [Cucumis sativus]
MKNFPITIVVCIFVVATTVALLNGAPPVVAQVECDPSQLSSCTAAFFGMTPSQTCCNKLREAQPCYCEYINDPDLRSFVNSSAARRIAKSCNISLPTEADCSK